MPDTKCHLYDIIDPEPDAVRPEVWQQIQQQMNQSKWFGEQGKRTGFVSVIQSGVLVAGFFAQEGQKRGIQYTDDKIPVDAPLFSFEHLFFAIFMDTAQLLLQHKNIYGYDDLSLPGMRTAFLELLANLLRLSDVRVAAKGVKLFPGGEVYTQEELFAFFIENSVVRVEVRGLRLDMIPAEGDPKYRLYNPKDEWNETTWGAVAETLKVGTRNVVLEAPEQDPDAQLNKGPLPKAFAAIGDIQEVVARNERGNIVIRKVTSDEEITIDLPSHTSISVPVLDLVLSKFESRSRVESWHKRTAKRKTAQLQGTLFDTDKERSNHG